VELPDMGSKLLIIIASGDREKILTAMMYSNNALKRGGFDDVKIIFFGPSEQLVAEDEEIRERTESLAGAIECIACKAISDKQGVSKELEGLGVKVEYVGSIVSGLIKTGYIPMVW
jgi:hypothetical protein